MCWALRFDNKLKSHPSKNNSFGSKFDSSSRGNENYSIDGKLGMVELFVFDIISWVYYILFYSDILYFYINFRKSS